ncbi:GAF domain-containing sensor histidine kinase [bacterium]|nr:GAF domain-containing sensor histidine kinase [bacterium]
MLNPQDSHDTERPADARAATPAGAPLGPGDGAGTDAPSSYVAVGDAARTHRAHLPAGLADADLRRLVDELRARVGADLVGACVLPDGKDPAYSWDYVSGNLTNRYQRIFLPSGVGVLGLVATNRRPLVVRDAWADISRDAWYQFPIVLSEGLESFYAFPLADGDRPALAVIVAWRSPGRVTDEATRLAERLAGELTGLAVLRARPLELRSGSVTPQYAETTHRIIQAQEDERKRIARELHDGLAQELLLVQIELRKARYLPQEERDDAIQRASDQLRDVLVHVSSIASHLRPTALDELGLAAAISAECAKLERTFGITVLCDVEDVRDLNPDCEIAVYRIFQEASSNACKYSRSDRMHVSLACGDGAMALVVQDFGQGFDVDHPEVRGGGLGLAGMRERASAFGGTIRIVSRPGVGTTVELVVPYASSGGQAAGGQADEGAPADADVPADATAEGARA